MQRRAQITRQAVLEGAAASFEKLGYGTASLSTILATAGVSKGAMYFHFSSKEELAHAVIDAQHQMAMVGIERAAKNASSAASAIVLASKEMARQLVNEPIARGGMRLTMEIGSMQGPVTQPYIDWIDSVRGLANRARTEGDISDGVDVEALARFICGAFVGVQISSEILTGRTDLYERLTEMWTLLIPSVIPSDRRAELLALAAGPPEDWPQDLT